MKEILIPKSDGHIRETLLRLNDFFSAYNIEYAVTGTTALYLLGAYTGKHEGPHDIDLRVNRLTDEQKKAIEQQQTISGRKSKDYGGQMYYMFECNSVLVNVLVVDDVTSVSFDSVKVEIADFKNGKRALVNVQDVYNSLREKMKLGRPKDKDFMLCLIASLSNL